MTTELKRETTEAKIRNPISILFRVDDDNRTEYEICRSLFGTNVYKYRSQIPDSNVVIGRYSVLPYYKELEEELDTRNSQLINSYRQHRYIADMEYITDIVDYTPKTYSEWGNLPEGKYVVKGKTNSRKHEWSKRMFAQSKDDIKRVVHSLLDDCLVSEQGLVVREYIPLKTYGHGINDLPITNEWRFFFLGDMLLSYDYYWANFSEYKPYHELPTEAIDLAYKVSDRIKDRCSFYVVDIAETDKDEWICIEVNDGQMSGLSMNQPNKFYNNLNRIINS